MKKTDRLGFASRGLVKVSFALTSVTRQILATLSKASFEFILFLTPKLFNA